MNRQLPLLSRMIEPVYKSFIYGSERDLFAVVQWKKKRDYIAPNGRSGIVVRSKSGWQVLLVMAAHSLQELGRFTFIKNASYELRNLFAITAYRLHYPGLLIEYGRDDYAIQVVRMQ